MAYFYGKATNVPRGPLGSTSSACCASCEEGPSCCPSCAQGKPCAQCATAVGEFDTTSGLVMIGLIFVGGIALMNKIAKAK